MKKNILSIPFSYDKNLNSFIINIGEDMNKSQLLKKYFGYDTFRFPQDKIIDAILEGEDVVAILPTGYGKSVIFQISALMLKNITLIISPLIALMEDQVSNLKKKNISALVLHSNLTNVEQEQAFEKIQQARYKIIYVSPERLQNLKFLRIMKKLNISLLVVDEAHTILWGETFRSSFLEINSFIEELDLRPTILALTATATPLSVNKIIEYLNMRKPKLFEVAVDRANLFYSVIPVRNKIKELKNFIRRQNKKKGIIYCLTRKTVENLWQILIKHGFSVAYYHGGMDIELKKKNQDLFTSNICNIMVCTNAFGMGIDIPKIRFVLQYDLPQTIEDLVQQMGRSSRDGDYGEGVVFFSFSDIRQVEYFIHNIEDKNLKSQETKKLDAVVEYCLTKKCRHQWISSYFGHELKRCRCMCDNCKK